MSITSHYYGRTQNGEEIYQYILENAAGMRVAVIEYGCVITNIWVKDNTGELRDVALGYSKLEDYELGGVFGAFIGRYANRIEKSRFTLDGKTYELEPNNGPNHLHGTFAKKVYKGQHRGRQPGAAGSESRRRGRLSGKPGAYGALYAYRRKRVGAGLYGNDRRSHHHQSDESQLFQPGGAIQRQHAGTDVVSERFHVYRGQRRDLPHRAHPARGGHPHGFHRAKPIGRDIQAEYSQLQMCGGYDHNFILDKEPGMLALAAVARSEKTGITMETYTTQPGVQLYTSNSLQNDTRPGKTGGIYGRYQGFCLETQHYPCTPSHPEFPSVELRPGEEYHETTIYKFLTE